MHPSSLEVAYLGSRIRRNNQRLLVVRLLAEANDHPTTETLFQRARLRDQAIGRTSVYRALSALVAAGLAAVHQPHRGMFRYEDNTRGEHDHLIDAATGEMIDFREEALERATREIAAQLGYRLVGRSLVIRGVRIAEDSAFKTPRRSV